MARDWLDRHGYASTVDYVAAMARLVTEDTGLLPHANTGAMTSEELQTLRAVAPSQGMMIESLNADLDAHRGAPDKTPERRLATLEAAGELRIPYTTGILVGIGESRADRIEALEAIAESHRRWGHVQEVIVQNFLPKPQTAMQNWAPCPRADHLDAISLARVILPPEVHVQAPPNLATDFGEMLAAGIDDWGGVSPVTADHVNPERPWPDLDRLREVTEAAGHVLAPRLTVHPSYVRDAGRWIDEGLHFAVIDRSDAEGLGRDDPGSQFPERTMERARAGDGADVELVGEPSTQWYSGAGTDPAVLVPAAAAAGGAVGEVLQGVTAGSEVGLDEIVTLFGARGPEVAAVAEVADDLRRSIVGDDVTWVANRNINYTNVCTFKCRFCGFSKGPLSLNLRGTPYLLEISEIVRRSREAWDLGATEVCLQGGIHPEFDGDYYIDVARAVHAEVPGIHIHGFTALEVTEGARRNREPLHDYLRRLMAAGQQSLPGTAAEILDDEVRETLCPDKITTDEWLECHRIAHGIGLGSNVTIMFGSIERPEHWARHMLRTRALQASTGGFTEFVGLALRPHGLAIYLQRRARRGRRSRGPCSARRRPHRLPGLLDNIQGSWVKLGFRSIEQLLQAGVNDLGGTLMDENISRAAGAEHGQGASAEEFERLVGPLGRRLVQRTTLYGRVDPDSAPPSDGNGARRVRVPVRAS